MNIMKRQLVEKDVELRQQRQTILTLYELMGSPDKPDKKRKPGKYGSATYVDPYVSTDDILKKMIHKLISEKPIPEAIPPTKMRVW